MPVVRLIAKENDTFAKGIVQSVSKPEKACMLVFLVRVWRMCCLFCEALEGVLFV